MSLPASFTRVLALLKRISPSWPSLEPDKSTGKEMGSIAVALAMAADAVDAVVDEIFPDTTTFLIDRWEKITKNPIRTSDDLPTRRSRVMSVLRRISGPRLAQLEKMLAPLLALDVSDIIWVEPLRSMIEEALTETTGIVSLATPTTITFSKLWPGVVDDAGVQVYLAMTGIGDTAATLTSPSGTVWTIPSGSTTGWYFTRDKFTGEPAGGTWTLSIIFSAVPPLTEARLLVSNNVDSGQIYNFYALRDPSLSGTADLIEAQRLFRKTALGNMRAFVIETLAFTVGDPHSLCGRDPIGA